MTAELAYIEEKVHSLLSFYMVCCIPLYGYATLQLPYYHFKMLPEGEQLYPFVYSMYV